MNNKSNAKKVAAKHNRTPRVRFPEFQDAEGWKEAELLTIARPVFERAINGDGDKALSLSGEHGIVLQSDYFGKKVAGDNAERYIKIARNDFVYNDRTTKQSIYGTIKRLSKYEGGIVSPIYKCFRFNSDENPVFWDWYFESGVHESELGALINEGARAGRFNISIDKFLSVSVWRPCLLEQQQIADCLTSVDELIADHGKKLDALKDHKYGLMQQLFPRDGETQPSLRFPEFQDSGEWVEKQIGDLKPFVTSGSRGWAAYYADQGQLFVRMTNLSRESILLDLTDSKFVRLPVGENEGVRTQLKEHDVLISITADIGIIGYVDASVPSPAYINQHIALVRFDESQLCGKFVAYFLASETSERLFRVSSDVGAKAGMSLLGVQKIKVVLPPPPEQRRIADCLTSLDDLIAAQTQKLAALKTHKKELMKQLFPSPEEAL